MPIVISYFPNLSVTPDTTTLFVIGGMLGGILPDIDNPNSYMGRLSVPISSIFKTIGLAKGKTGSKHRGIMHDPILYIIGLILAYYYYPPLISLCVGCLSHIFLDMFNPAGVPFLFGISNIRLGKIPSGSKTSIIFTWINILLVFALMIGAYIAL